jgi:plastocyanin
MSSSSTSSSAPPRPVRALGPAIIIVIILLAAALGYYQLIVYHPPTTTTAAILDPYQVNVTLPVGASVGVDRGFTPNTITVMVGYNATVNWFNNDSVEHTITANLSDSSIPTGGPNFLNWATSGNDIQPTVTLTYTFIAPGTYYYYCAIHPTEMAGTVIVLAGSNSTSSSSSSTTSSVSSTSAILAPFNERGAYLLFSLKDEASVFANNLATLTGSGIAP